MLRIGVDFGGVIVPTSTEDDGARGPFFDVQTEAYLDLSECSEASSVLTRLACNGHELHLVSKAGARIQLRTRQWLTKHGYLGTIFDYSRVHFCLQRHEKADICSEFGISLMIDDRLDVLQHCRGRVDHLVLFGAESSDEFVACPDWNSVEQYIESSA